MEWFRGLSPRARTTALVVFVGLAALAIGWWVGGYMACVGSAGGCQVRWESVTALGTWFAGLGTIAAFVIAAQAFRADQMARDAAERRANETQADRRRRERADAERISVRITWSSSSGGIVREGHYFFHNDTANTPAYKLEVTARPPQFPAMKTAKLEASHQGTGTIQRKTFPVDGAGFAVGSEEWSAATTSWLSQITFTYSLHEQRWRRTGNGDAELIEE